MKKPIKVFYAVQVSNFTKINGIERWILRNDACTNIMVGVVSTILEKYPEEFEFLIKLPPVEETTDTETLKDLFDSKYHDKISFLIDSIPISPVNSRFNFDFNGYLKHKDILSTIDVMINDENTLTKNWNVLFNHLGLKIPIISTNYFLDSPIAKKVPEKIRYYERQMESFINSNISAFQCEAGRIEAMEAFDLIYKHRSILSTQSVWGIGAHYREISKYHTEDKFEVPTIYFGNRISDTANRYTNYDSFAEAIGILSKMTNKPFRAVMLNPTRKVTREQLDLINKLSNGKAEVLSNEEKFTREDYLTFINKSHISCNLFVTEVHGGVTHCEALMAGNMVVMPRVNNYWHKFKKAGLETYPLFCNVSEEGTKPCSHDLATKINVALDFIGTNDEIMIRKTCQDVGYKYESYESACDRVVEDIKSLVRID